MNNNKQNGGVFFYILLAVGLIAGLTYVVSSGNRGNTSFITDEQAKVAAQEIIEYGNTVANAVQKLRLRGCSDTEISAQRDWNDDGVIQDVGSDGYLATAPVDKSCHIFDSNGGNINYNSFFNIVVTGQHRLHNLGCNNDNFECTELLYGIKNISEILCIKINSLIGISGIPEDANGSEGFSVYDGFPGGGGTIIGNTDIDLLGKTSACYQDIDNAEFHFYRALLIR